MMMKFFSVRQKLKAVWPLTGMKYALLFVLILLWGIPKSNLCFAQDQNNVNEAQQIFNAGQKFYDNGQYQSAADTLGKAIAFFEKFRDTTSLIRSLNLQGESIANLNQCDKALVILNRSLDLARTSLPPDHPELAQAYYFLSRALGGCARKFDEAIPLMQKSISINRKNYGEGPEVAFGYTFLGYMLYSKGRFDSAFVYLDKALKIREKHLPRDDVETSYTLYHLGRLHENKSEPNLALPYHLRAYKIQKAKLVSTHASLSNSIHQIGSVYQQLGNFDRALEYYKEALEMRKKSLGEDHANVAGSYFTIGNLCGSMYNYHEAIHYIKQGNTIIEKKYGDKSDILPTYEAYLGRMYGQLGDHKTALDYFEKARTMAEKNLGADHPYLGIVYNIIGDYYADAKGSPADTEFFKKAVAIFKRAYGANSTREADVLAKIGTTCARNKNFNAAIAYYKDAMKIYKSKMGEQNPRSASMYHAIGDAASGEGQYQQALYAYQKAFMALSENFNDSTGSGNPEIGKLGNKPLALRIANSKAQVLYYLSKKENRVEKLKDALHTYEFAVALIDEISSGYNLENARAELEKESRKVYSGAISTAHLLFTLTNDKSFINDAFVMSEKSKSAMLLENVRDDQAKMLAGVPDSLIASERDMKIELAYYRNKLHEAQKGKSPVKTEDIETSIFVTQQRYEQVKRKLEAQYPAYFNFKYNRSEASVGRLQQSLPDESTAVVEFFVGDSAIYKITIKKHFAHISKIKNDSRFSRLIKNYEKSLTDAAFILGSRHEADLLYAQSAYALYELLLKYSIEDHEKEITKLIIIPDDFLAQFNFGTLLKHKAGSEVIEYKNLDYLSKQCQISYTYSAFFLDHLQSDKGTAANMFAGFAPSYGNSYFSGLDTLMHPMTHLAMRSGNLALPGAEREVITISDFMDGDSWLDKEATETNFKAHAGDYNILHLAMHSLLNNEDPHYSELLFSPENDNQNDGFLNIAEIYNLRLNASMVVLSACSSGFGKIQKGEGPISISRAFSYAGCPSVVMTLWKIPDEITGRIMTSFYQELKNGKEKDEALRIAQIKFLSETGDPLYQHPYFWAGFVVMGDTAPIRGEFPVWIIYVCGTFAVLLIVFIILKKKKTVQSAISAPQESQVRAHA